MAAIVSSSSNQESRRKVGKALTEQEESGYGLEAEAKMKIESALLMVGSCSTTHRVNKAVIRVARIVSDPDTTQANATAMVVETNVYKILGDHERIAACLYLAPTGDVIVLQHYESGNLKDHIIAHGPTQLHKWAKQMIEAVEYMHNRGVRHSDIKLCQWLLDSGMNARLSDFNGCGYDEQPFFGFGRMKALSYERHSHFMPRDLFEDSTVGSDLFALGSALYELEHGSSPFVEINEDKVTDHFTRAMFPPISKLALGRIILGCWRGQYDSAAELLRAYEKLCQS